MAAGMVRAGILTMVWYRALTATRDLAGLGGGVAETTAPW
jgi:hypothetical protein